MDPRDCAAPAATRQGVARWLPIVGWVPGYRKGLLRPDVLAGLTVWALLVPEAMAYAEIAGMPAETGLYAAIGAIVGYAVFGTSRQLFVGPSSTVAILSAGTVAVVVTNGDWVDVTIALALLVGAFFIVGGVLRLGFISVFMSKPVLTGFTFGLGLVIAVGQLDKLFGVEGGDGNFFQQLWAVIKELPDADARTTLIGLGALAILLVSRKVFGHKVPMALLVVFVAIILSNALDWEAAGVHVVGQVPAALPKPTLPHIDLRQWFELTGGALGIVLIAFAESFGTAKGFARRHDYPIRPNQEMIALGAANAGAGLLGGFTVDGSLSRSSAADGAGARSQMAMLICGAITLATIVAFTPIFEQLPEAILAAVVISAVWGTFNVAELRRVYRANRGDFVAALIALIGVCAIDLLPGLVLAVLTSFTLLVYRASRPGMPTLGRVPGERFYVSTKNLPEAEVPDGLIVVRLDAPLIFANAEAFHARIDQLIADAPALPRAMVINLETVDFIDTDGGDELRAIKADLDERGIGLAICRLNRDGRDALRANDVYDHIGAENFFPTVEAGVAAMSPGRSEG
jgi:SulP family sulfate permease